MRIRELRQSDVPRLLELFHQQDFEYSLPDFSKMSGSVLVDDSDRALIALAARPTVEEYMLIDNSSWATPGLKLEHFRAIHEAERRRLKRQGYEDAHVWIPPVCRSFARRLMKTFHWVKSSGDGQPWLGLTRDI